MDVRRCPISDLAAVDICDMRDLVEEPLIIKKPKGSGTLISA